MFNWLKKAITLPTEFALEGYAAYAEFTPDIAILEQKVVQLLFVYDRLLKDHADHNLIEEYAIPLGVAHTKKDFVVFKRRRGIESYPVALEASSHTSPKAPIKGELYAVQSTRFIELDTVKRNGVHFSRKRVQLIVPYRVVGWTKEQGMRTSENKYQNVWAWMYVGDPDFWDTVVDDERFIFTEVRTYEPRNPELKQYYAFTKLEYNR